MAIVTEVKDGMWLVNFSEFQLETGKSHRMHFRVNQINYALYFSVNETVASARLTVGKIIFYYYYILQTKFINSFTFR
jgi:hypothetical protein